MAGLESVFKLSLIMNMIDNLSGPMSKVEKGVGGSVGKLQAMEQTFGSVTKTGIAMAAIGGQITEAALSPVAATFETKKALGELASLGIEDLQRLENAAASFSNQWAGTTKADFITAAYDIKSGISSLSDEGVAKYTEMSGLTAKATKATIAEMTDLFATGYGIYKGFYADLSDTQFGEVFSAGISESVRAFKTSGSGMAESIKTLGASATTAQVPLEEQLAVLGMLQATMSGSEAGTKYKAFLRSAVKGGEELGLSFTDANNNLLNMPEILEKLRGKFGYTMDAAEKMKLQKAFGDTEAVALIDLMYSKTGDLQSNIVSLYNKMGEGLGVATDMANAINATEPDKYQRLTQQINNVKESIGNSLLPTVNEYLAKGGELLTKVNDWVNKHQELTRIIMLVVLAIGGFLTVAGTAIAVVGGIGLVFTKTIGNVKGFIGIAKQVPSTLETIQIYGMYAGDGMKKGFSVIKTASSGALTAVKNVGTGVVGFGRQAVTTATTALAPLITSVWSFTAALLANPITWIVIGIIALVAGIILLYNKCEWFRNLVNAVGAAIAEKFGAALKIAKAAFQAVGNVIGTVMGAASATVSEKLSNIKRAYQENGGGIKGIAAAAMEGVKGYYSAGFTFMDNLTGGKLSAIRDKVAGGMENVKSAISNSIAWFRESGRKIMTTFTDGIKSAIAKPVEAVKGGLQKIRNMLPFSDAKTGPLSTLTLSGKRTMSTYASGVEQAKTLPGQATGKALQAVSAALSMEPQSIGLPQTVGIGSTYPEARTAERRGSREFRESQNEENGENSSRISIRDFRLSVDFSTIKELPLLLKLLEDTKAYIYGNGMGDVTLEQEG